MKSFELRIPPPALAVGIAVLMGLLALATPALRFGLPYKGWIALAFVVAGFAVAVLGLSEFSRAHTTANPHTPDKAAMVVSSGIYRFTRNPMYLGLLLFLVGWASFLANGLTFVGLPLFVIAITRLQIMPEETVLLAKFGDEYEAYTNQVRRWL